ncbi:conserved hypothetical protein [Ricinus communis]|uniref:Uncharacterized protein n=1 Tax=Ricinus communis TaxID=3988 RepID=B9SRB3_RICCO|nr:conserved hypothetical protein [Ricinus communis]
MTEQEDRKEFVSLSPLPILARLDRLEHMLQIFQEKNRSLPVWTSPSAIEMEGGGGEQYCKTLSSALQEVQLKGNIIERLQSLENRVAEIKTLKYSKNASRSGSSVMMTTKVK